MPFEENTANEYIASYVQPHDAGLTDTGFMVQFNEDDDPMYFENVWWDACGYPNEGEYLAERATLDGKEIKRERIIHLIGAELLHDLEDSYADEMAHS